MSGPVEQTVERVAAAVSEALGEALDCTRVWSAWGCGTMDENDFVQVADDAERVDEIARAAIAAMPDTKAKARNDALREAAAVADDVMISSMNGALSGLPEYARNRESMANSAERIKIRILALIDKEPTP